MGRLQSSLLAGNYALFGHKRDRLILSDTTAAGQGPALELAELALPTGFFPGQLPLIGRFQPRNSSV